MAETAYKGTVLLVDDVQMTRTLMRTFLVADGYRVIGEAGNGEDGLEMALRLKPDVVCLDVQMPKSDGLSVLREIRAAALMTAVIMVTSSVESEIVETAINDGAVGYIIKPFNSGRVLDAVDGAMKKLAVARAAAAIP
jgi:two-component system, chemotaxis family, chemotaxis protein CheY